MGNYSSSNPFATRYHEMLAKKKADEETAVKRLSQYTKFHVTVDKVIWKNGEGTFFIVAVSSKNPKGDFTIKTTYPFMTEGGIYDMEGEWAKDRKYGLQFTAKNVSQASPDTEGGMERYLANNIDGVGKKTAHLIVSAFSINTKSVLDNSPKKLYEVRTLRKSTADKIIKSWEEHKEVNTLYTYLSSIHVDGGNAKKIYEKYGNKSIEKIKENPYCLTNVEGVGFTTADNVAKELGIRTDNPFRIRSGIIYTLEDNSVSGGNVYETRKELTDSAVKLLNISDETKIATEIDYLVDNGLVIQESKAIYSPKLYEAECETADRIINLLKQPMDEIKVSDQLGKSEGIEYDEVQMDAIKMAMKSKVMVLTGGPGTGKTTTTKGIISAWKEAKLDIILAAPTGRAAKRLSEATGMEASTIHRLLGYKGKTFEHDDNNPIEGDALIVDESSMIDIELMRSLLRAIPDNMRIILVGDVDQLPSVGPGNVLRDIIESGVVPVVKLTRIFRQAQNSRIITNAHLIDEGKPIVYDNNKNSDFFFLEQDDNEKIAETIIEMVTSRLPSFTGVKPVDIQVLSPMKKSSNGVLALNKLLQAAINPTGPELQFGSTTFRIGDKVMQIKNDYDNDVFNGDMGFVVNVDNEEETIYVDFGKKAPVEYTKKELPYLSLAYACTIHKSQGSEYPIVVMPFTMQFYIMLQRNLLYTGVTRAKKVCVLIGDKKAVNAAIRNGKTAKRNTMLKERMRKNFKEVKP